MWTPAKIESRIATLNLSASAQGLCTVRQVICDDVVICNAAEHIDWTACSVQFELCEACLVVGCSSGGRVVVRRFGNDVLIIPDFSAMIKGDWETTEYAPPRWMEKRGPLVFSPSNWSVFQSACVGAPSFDTIEAASTSEVLRLYHFQAPRSFLPDYLSPSHAKWDLILCTSGHDSDIDLVHLRRLFSDVAAFDSHVFCKPQTDSYTVSAFLDLPSISEWPIFSSEPEPAFLISGDIYFIVNTKS